MGRLHKQADTGHHANIRALKMTPEIKIKVDIYVEAKTQEMPSGESHIPYRRGKGCKGDKDVVWWTKKDQQNPVCPMICLWK